MKGGKNRIDILCLLLKDSLNANQIKEVLRLDYKTVQHHLRLLLKNKFISNSGKTYGSHYMLTEEFRSQIHLFNEILAKINKSKRKK
jgi:predicted transcriptional regulator